IGQAHELADHDCERDRADQIGSDHCQHRVENGHLFGLLDYSGSAQLTGCARKSSTSTCGASETRKPRLPPLIQILGRSSTVCSTNTGMVLRVANGEVPPMR